MSRFGKIQKAVFSQNSYKGASKHQIHCIYLLKIINRSPITIQKFIKLILTNLGKVSFNSSPNFGQFLGYFEKHYIKVNIAMITLW